MNAKTLDHLLYLAVTSGIGLFVALVIYIGICEASQLAPIEKPKQRTDVKELIQALINAGIEAGIAVDAAFYACERAS